MFALREWGEDPEVQTATGVVHIARWRDGAAAIRYLLPI